MKIGLKVVIIGSELSSILSARAVYHAERAEFYARKIKLLEGINEKEAHESDVEFTTLMSNYTGQRNPLEDLRAKLSQHQSKQKLQSFIADHLVLGEFYELTDDELRKFEIAD